VVRILSSIRELAGSNFGWNATYSEAVHVRSQTQQTNARKILKKNPLPSDEHCCTLLFYCLHVFVAIWFQIRKHHQKITNRIRRVGQTIANTHDLEGDKTHFGHFRCISFLSITNEILSNCFLSRLTQYLDKINGNYLCGFRRNR
jgi:hypothetical protein